MDYKLVDETEIIIFSHPAKRHLSSSGWCRVKRQAKNRNSDNLIYNCDTEGGSSGSVILNQNMKVIGIHNFGSTIKGHNGGTPIDLLPELRDYID